MGELPWYRELFGEDYLLAWGPSLSPERTARELEGIEQLLAPAPGSRILDLCCGHGRHAVPLALRGHRVSGLDLSEVFLARARAEAEEAGAAVDWILADMREIPFEEEFDIVLNLFTAFGYLESDEEDLAVLRGVRRALKPGGRFLLETGHRDSMLRRYRPHSIERLDDGTLVLHEGTFDLIAGRNDVRVTLLVPDGSRREYRFSVRMYTVAELARMIAAAGLELLGCYGGLDGSDLTLDSRRLALLAARPS